jgi:hypothetical protein
MRVAECKVSGRLKPKVYSLGVQEVSTKPLVTYREISNMRFILASALLLPMAFGSIGYGAISLADTSPPVAQILADGQAADADSMPDLELAANGKRKGPKGAVDHGIIAQPVEQAGACGKAKRRGPKTRDNVDVGKVIGEDTLGADAKITCPPPKDFPPAAKGKGPKLRDKVPQN